MRMLRKEDDEVTEYSLNVERLKFKSCYVCQTRTDGALCTFVSVD